MKYPKQLVAFYDDCNGDEKTLLASERVEEFATDRPNTVGIYRLVETVKVSTKVVMSKRKVR